MFLGTGLHRTLDRFLHTYTFTKSITLHELQALNVRSNSQTFIHYNTMTRIRIRVTIDVIHAYRANVSKSAVMVFARDAVEGSWK